MADQPTVTQRTADLYGQLPQYQRDADPTYGYGLLRFLSLLGDQADVVRKYLVDPQQLLNPTVAPYSVLPWLAMLAGVDYTLYPDTDGNRGALRAAIAAAAGSRRPGSDAAILNAVQPLLLGSKIAYISSKNPGGYTYTVSVYRAQVADQAAVQRVIDLTTPAGLRAFLNVIPGLTWGDVNDQYTSWAAMADTGLTWEQMLAQVPNTVGRRTWAQVGDRTWSQVQGLTWDQFARQ